MSWNDMINPKVEGICNAHCYTKGIMFPHFSFAIIMLCLFFTMFYYNFLCVVLFQQSIVFCFVPHNVFDNSSLCFSLERSVHCFVIYNVIDKISFCFFYKTMFYILFFIVFLIDSFQQTCH